MKLSIVSKLKTLLSALGVPARGDLSSSFPTRVNTEYLPVWQEFLNTQAVRDLTSKYPKDLTRYYVCAGFVSYIDKLDSKAVRPRVDLLQSVDLYNPAPAFKIIYDYLTVNRFISGLKLRNHDHRHSISVTESDFLNAFVAPTTNGIMEYKVQGRAPLDKYLGVLTPQVFKRPPVELLRETKGKKRNLLRPNSQADATTGWVPLLNKDGIKLDMARAQFGTVLFRYSFTVDVIMFHGGTAPDKLEKAIKKKHERSILLP